jgi:hypothetical protein
VITGDTVHPLGDYEYEGRWISAMEYIKSTNIPYVCTGGNLMEKMSRYDALQIDKNFGGEQSWTGFKWNEDKTRVNTTPDLLGYYTSRVPILDATAT